MNEGCPQQKRYRELKTTTHCTPGDELLRFGDRKVTVGRLRSDSTGKLEK
jgi:hypothetical protein